MVRTISSRSADETSDLLPKLVKKTRDCNLSAGEIRAKYYLSDAFTSSPAVGDALQLKSK